MSRGSLAKQHSHHGTLFLEFSSFGVHTWRCSRLTLHSGIIPGRLGPNRMLGIEPANLHWPPARISALPPVLSGLLCILTSPHMAPGSTQFFPEDPLMRWRPDPFTPGDRRWAPAPWSFLGTNWIRSAGRLVQKKLGCPGLHLGAEIWSNLT